MSYVQCVCVRGCVRETFLLLFEPHEFRLFQRHCESYNRGAHAEVSHESAVMFAILQSVNGSEVSGSADDFECIVKW